MSPASREIFALIAELEAAQDALVLANEHADNLERALASRDVIGQAKGIIMERTGKNADEAFTALITMSQHANEKLRLVAEEVVKTSENRPS